MYWIRIYMYFYIKIRFIIAVAYWNSTSFSFFFIFFLQIAINENFKLTISKSLRFSSFMIRHMSFNCIEMFLYIYMILCVCAFACFLFGRISSCVCVSVCWIFIYAYIYSKWLNIYEQTYDVIIFYNHFCYSLWIISYFQLLHTRIEKHQSKFKIKLLSNKIDWLIDLWVLETSKSQLYQERFSTRMCYGCVHFNLIGTLISMQLNVMTVFDWENHDFKVSDEPKQYIWIWKRKK